MKLNEITLSNVGPYAGRVHLDVTALGDVFLICGKTGSGKTTIFDAVAYALYGQSATTRELASHYAGDTDDVYVELDFNAAGERWRVIRKPQRTVAKKRGTGTTERPAVV
ncbi:MAG: SMC family ATPase, partial [Spirochaetales bacterium]|nr:SMC family ATPase [Spirochaetales bacterium]